MSAYREKPRLTITELRPVIDFYQAHFPSWSVIQQDTLAREAGPLVQAITFDRISDGAYRPTGHIRTLVVPQEVWAFELPQFLNVKVRQISRRQHPEFRDRVVEAIRSEFVPNVDRPLVPEEALKLYEREAYPPRSADAYSLAALNAYLGHIDRALYWSAKFTELVDKGGGQWQDFDHKRRAFLDQLESWIRAGTARQELEHVLQAERKKWGLA